MGIKISSRERILEIAARVFYKHGYRATGMDFLAREAGITKATLYHHFKNKDELIAHALHHLSSIHRANYQKAWSKKKLTPKAKLTALFDAMEAHLKQPDCYGCPFINAASEFTDRTNPVREICHEHYSYLTTHLEQFAREAGLKTPRKLALELTTIIAGTYTSWYVANHVGAAAQGKLAAKRAIAAYATDA